MTTPRQTVSVFASRMAVLGLALLVAACGQTAPSSRAGGEPGPVTLRIGTYEAAGTPEAEQIAQFAREVEQRSAGSLRVEPAFQVVRPPAADFDQEVARQVADGRLDGANVPARAWDALGVTTLRALNAPFLVTSPSQVADIVTGDLAPELLGGLNGAGVTGLGLVPDDMRRLVFFSDTLLPPTAIAGRVIRSPRSDTVYAVLKALGGTPDDLGDDNSSLGHKISDGTVVAAETSLGLAGSLPQNGTTAANVVLFPKVNSLVLNTKVFSGLDPSRQAAVRDAAAATTTWWLDRHSPDESTLARAYCDAGGRVVQADGAQVAALRTAVAPVLADLEADPATGALITRIRERVAASPAPAPIASCEPAPRGIVVADTGIGNFPVGTYRVSFTLDELIAGGVDPGTAQGYGSSTWTMNFRPDGRVTFDEPDGFHCEEAFSEAKGRLQVVYTEKTCPTGNPAGELDFAAAWALDGDQLRLTRVEPGPNSVGKAYTVIFDKGVTKIG